MKKYLTFLSHLVCVMAFFVCCACGKQKAPLHTSLDNFPVDSLKMGDSVNLTDFGILGAELIARTDSSLVIYQTYDDEGLIYCLNGNSIAKGVALGQGPEDVLDINLLQWDATNGLYSYDHQKGLISFFQVNDSLVTIKKTMDAPRLLDDAVVVENLLVAFPLVKDYSVAIMDEEGSVLDSLTYFPPKPDGIPSSVHALACTGRTAGIPSGEFARCVLYDGGIDFYAVENNRLKHAGRFALFDMVYNTLDQGVATVPVPSKESKTGFNHIASSADKFFAAYSDRLLLENPEGYSDKIYRFSKDGQLEKIYALDREFLEFTVDPQNKEIQVLAREDDNDVIRTYYLH